MADALIEILSGLVKSFLPGSELFLLVGLTVGVVLLLAGRGRRRAAAIWLTALAILYWVLSLPIVPQTLEAWLGAGYKPLTSAADARGARHIVVLGGGNVTLQDSQGSFDIPSTATGYRLLEAERLFRMLEDSVLILSGGPSGALGDGTPESESMRAALVARGVPPDRILLDSESRDTHHQALRVGELLSQEGVDTFILVTSAAHMRRALGAFTAEGMHPIPSAALDRSTESEVEASPFLPSTRGLNESELVFRELFGSLYYTLRGWSG
jgi:uncharacterized SAM-binding protein YcdF (DUF218 family)